MNLITLTVIIAMAAAKTETPKQQHASAAFVLNEDIDKPLGYFTVHEKTVEIHSLNGTIHMTLPRMWEGRWQSMTKAEQEQELKQDRERVWPLSSPEYTSEFLEWTGRVQRATDAGITPPK